MNFAKKDYYKEKLEKITASKKKYTEIEFEDCVFEKCRLVECNFEKCKFINCKFKECVLSAVKLTNSKLVEIKFLNSKATGFDWVLASRVNSISFTDCQLDYSNFSLLKLPEIVMTNCHVHEVDFTQTDLKKGNFQGSDFTKSRFFKTNLSNADFRNATNYSIDCRQNTVKNAKFSLPEAISLLGNLDIVIET